MATKNEIECVQKLVGKRYLVMLVILVGEMLFFGLIYGSNNPSLSPFDALLGWTVGVATMAASAMIVFGPIIDLAYFHRDQES